MLNSRQIKELQQQGNWKTLKQSLPDWLSISSCQNYAIALYHSRNPRENRDTFDGTVLKNPIQTKELLKISNLNIKLLPASPCWKPEYVNLMMLDPVTQKAMALQLNIAKQKWSTRSIPSPGWDNHDPLDLSPHSDQTWLNWNCSKTELETT